MDRPLVPVAAWTTVGLVVLVSDGADDAPLARLDALSQSGYEGALVLLATHLDAAVRRRAFAQGALDVITLPADLTHIEVRLQAVLQTARAFVSRPAP